jgi:hypothetical protein
LPTGLAAPLHCLPPPLPPPPLIYHPMQKLAQETARAELTTTKDRVDTDLVANLRELLVYEQNEKIFLQNQVELHIAGAEKLTSYVCQKREETIKLQQEVARLKSILGEQDDSRRQLVRPC